MPAQIVHSSTSRLWKKNSSWMTVLLLLVVSVAASGASIVLLWLMLHWDPLKATKQDDLPIWEIFFSLFGLVYAIVVGLFIVEAHRRMRELSSLVQGEHNAIDDVNDFLRYFQDHKQDTLIKRIKGRIFDYAQELPGQLTKPDVREIHRQRQAIEDIIDCVVQLEPPSLAAQGALQGLVRTVADLTTCRSQAADVARRGFPKPFYALLILFPLVIVVGFSLMDIQSEALHIFLISITSLAMTWLFLLVWDLDHPMMWFWNIRDDVEDYIDDIRNDIGRREAKRPLPTSSSS